MSATILRTVPRIQLLAHGAPLDRVVSRHNSAGLKNLARSLVRRVLAATIVLMERGQLELTEDLLIGEGQVRRCYRHPENPALVVKTCYSEESFAQQKKEIDYYAKLARRRITILDYHFYTRFHGSVRTNRGLGYVYDHVRDAATGQTSRTLEWYLDHDSDSGVRPKLAAALDRLKRSMIFHRIFVADLAGKNLCCQVAQDESVKLIVVDGLGSRDFVPLAEYSQTLSLRKVQRRFDRCDLERRCAALSEHS